MYIKTTDGNAIRCSSSTRENPLLALDVYKMGHLEQYKPGVTKVFSYLMARSGKMYDKTVFFGLQYFLNEYLSKKLEPWMATEFLAVRKAILGFDASPEVEQKIHALCKLGYWPLKIRAVEEGTVVPIRNVLMTMESTLKDFHWCVGLVESLILKVWYPTTVASMSYRYREQMEKFAAQSSDSPAIKFSVHDFGYRSDSSEEGAALSGVAHLLSFVGSDNVPAFIHAVNYYNADTTKPVMMSVPASEHSVMCSFGKDNELEAFHHMLDTYPNSIVSIVSDTYSIWEVLTKYAVILREKILARPEGARVIFRPDSGDPQKVLCGDPDAEKYSPEWYGVIRLLDNVFGSDVNSKGYRVINRKVGVLYGDGMYFERWVQIVNTLHSMGYSVDCLDVIGIGGILRFHSRDTFGFALKATYIEIYGAGQNIMKDPITDRSKKSHEGIVGLFKDNVGEFFTKDHLTWDEFEQSELNTVFLDGMLTNMTDLTKMRDLIDRQIAGGV